MQIQFPDNSGACEGDSGGPVFVSSDKQLYLIALNTAITPDLNKQCGTTLDANVITASRYEWIEKTATALRAQLK
jgi:secreted trypsin-like serine protease